MGLTWWYSVCSSTTERTSRVKRVGKLQTFDKFLDVRVGCFHLSPLALPYLHYLKSLALDFLDSMFGEFVHIVESPTIEPLMLFISDGVTFGATMPEASVEFIHCFCVRIITIDFEIGFRNGKFTTVLSGLKIITIAGVIMIRVGH